VGGFYQSSWEGDYFGTDFKKLRGYLDVHTYSFGFNFNILLSQAQEAYSLQWSDPFEDAETDLDLFLFTPEYRLLAASTNRKRSYEEIFHSHEVGDRLVIARKSGPPKYIRLDGGLNEIFHFHF